MPTATTSTHGTSSGGPTIGATSHLAAYLRVLDPGRKFAEPSIGRVLTVPPHRGTGLGRVLMAKASCAHAASGPGVRSALPHSSGSRRSTRSLGFKTASAPYQEDNIPHVDMLLDAA